VFSTGVIYNENVGVAMINTVGFYQNTIVGMTRSVSVGQDQNTSIGQNNTLTIGKKHTETIGKTFKHIVGTKATYEVGQWQSTYVRGTYVVEALDRIELRCGAATLVLASDGSIYLNGAQMHAKFSTQIAEDAGVIDINTGVSKAPPPCPKAPSD
jgi:type VI secretion system secreted protein VgrG